MPLFSSSSKHEAQNAECKMGDKRPPPAKKPVKPAKPVKTDPCAVDPCTGRSPYEKFLNSLNCMIDGPVTWLRKNVIEKDRTPYPWYHEHFKRVPTIDKCYTDDVICYFEANMQFKRDQRVDNEILGIVRQRFEECVLYEAPDHLKNCKLLHDQYKTTLNNWFTKYGDLGPYGDVRSAFMKQKHRMIWEERHGKVGVGMRKGKKNIV